jgi:hypothetical protein
MNLDMMADNAFTQFSRAYPTNSVAADVFRHYAQNELRLVGIGLEDFVSRAIDEDRVILDVIEYQRFFCWYYVNYVLAKQGLEEPPIRVEPSGYSFSFPSCLYATLLKTADDKPVGIVQYSSFSSEYRAAVEECIRLYRNVKKATITRVISQTYRLERIVLLLEPGQESTSSVEIFIGQYLLCF